MANNPISLWGDWLDELMAWFDNPPKPEFCPCCGLLLVPSFFLHGRDDLSTPGESGNG